MDKEKYTTMTVSWEKEDEDLKWFNTYCKELKMTRSKVIRRMIQRERKRATRGEDA